MAVPKRRTSKARKRSRRTHWKLDQPNLDRCPKCGEPRPSHRVCDSCGHYGESQITEVQD
jgi:large subunit ribosomal protein L32